MFKINILTLGIKKRREAIELYKKGGREDLAQKEADEVSLLQNYLPQALSTEEIQALINETILEVKAESIKDFGKVMKLVVSKTKGRADSSKISELIKQHLNKE